MTRRAVAIAAVLGCALAVAPAALAEPRGPDRPFRTPVTGNATERSQALGAMAQGTLSRRAKGLLRKLGGRVGAWAGDLETGETIFGFGAARRIPIASNTKLFTTATALERFGPRGALVTRVAATAEPAADGLLRGRLLLVGGGDPTLGAAGIGRLAKAVAATGLRRVSGGLAFDDSVFDRRLRVPTHGVTGGPFLGSLSGLSLSGGWGASGPLADPARAAAKMLVAKLAARGVTVSGKVRRGLAGEETTAVTLAERQSPTVAQIAALTNKPSDNFVAEMLVKSIGADAVGRGTTRAGMRLVRRHASSLGARLRAENGSGLSRRNVASARGIGQLLRGIEQAGSGVRNAFMDSLAVAGRDGTLAYRMRGSAAEGRCRGKTGTLDGVSALSGYCLRGTGEPVAFSILSDGVDTAASRLAQDRIVSLIARYAR